MPLDDIFQLILSRKNDFPVTFFDDRLCLDGYFIQRNSHDSGGIFSNELGIGGAGHTQ